MNNLKAFRAPFLPPPPHVLGSIQNRNVCMTITVMGKALHSDKKMCHYNCQSRLIAIIIGSIVLLQLRSKISQKIIKHNLK
jgi:hypothetical protein